MLEEMGIIALLIVGNGLFSGSEIAILAVRKTRLQQLAGAGSRTGAALLSLRDEPERLLATVQIGMTVLGAAAAAFGAVAFADRLAQSIGASGLGRFAEQFAFALVVAAISFASLVLGELVPKSLALRAAERYALAVSRPLLALSSLLRPAVWFLTLCSNFLLRWFNDETTFAETRLSPEEVRSVVQEAAESGSLDRGTGEIASRAFDLAHLTVAAVMVPRSNVCALSRSAPSEQIRGLLSETDHQRYPVYDGDENQVVGYVRARDALAQIAAGRDVDLAEILRPALFIPSTAQAVGGLQELQRSRTQLAMVVDERGDLAGIVTVQDFAAELVGQIFKEGERPAQDIVREDGGSALVSGSTPVHEVNRALALGLPESDRWSTVAGLALSRSGRMLDAGEWVDVGNGIRLEILEASARRVLRIRVHPRGGASSR